MENTANIIDLEIAKDEVQTIRKEDGAVYRFNFDVEETEFVRDGNNLLIEHSDGLLEIEDYFIAAHPEDLPMVMLDDELILTSDEFFSRYDPEVDTTPMPPEGSGVGEYSDNAGSLLNGVDRLGSLDTFRWESEQVDTEILTVSDGLLPSEPLEAPPVTPPITPPVPPVYPPINPPIVPPDPDERYSYQARAILHSQEDGGDISGYLVNTIAIFPQTRAWPSYPGTDVSIGFLGGDGEQFLRPVVQQDGSIIFYLNEDAAQYFLDHSGDDFIENYYQITVGGLTYNMQVLVPSKGAFESGSYHVGCKYGDHRGELMYGEWHAGRNLDDSGRYYRVVSTNMDDVMTYDGKVENSSIHTGSADDGDWGADKVTVNCHVAATGGESAEIIAKGAGSEILINGDRDGLGVLIASGGGSNTIEASGDGSSITVNNAGADGHGVDAGADSGVVIDASGDDGKVTFDVRGTAVQTSGAAVEIDASGSNGLVEITAGTGIRASDNGTTSVDATGAEGSITITASRNGVVADTAGTTANTLEADKNITVTVAGSGGLTGVGAGGDAPGGRNTLTSANGDVVIEADGQNNTGNGDYAHAIYGGNNTITAANGNVTVNAANSREAVAAGSHDGKTSITAQKVTLDATGENGAYGIKSDGGTVAAGVSITADEVRISSEAQGIHATSAAVYAGGAAGAENVIKAGDVLNIQANGQGQVNAVRAGAGGVNDITGTAAIQVGMDASTEWDASVGPFDGITEDFSSKAVHADGGSNSFVGQEMNVDVIGRGKGPSDETVFKGLTGTNKIETGLIGLAADNSGRSSVDVAGDLNITVRNDYEGVISYREAYDVNGHTLYHSIAVNPSSTGIYASSNGSNEITLGGDLNINTTARGDSYGIVAEYTAKNTVTVEGHISINGVAEEGAAYGVSAGKMGTGWSSSGGENIITAGSMTIDTAAENAAYGIHAKGTNTITLNGQNEGYALDLTAAGNGSYGMRADYASPTSNNTIINQGDGDIRIQSGYQRLEDGTTEKAAARGDAHGIMNMNTTLVDVGGKNMQVNASGANYVNGLYNTGGSLTIQNANLLEIQADGEHAKARIDTGTYSGTYGVHGYSGGSVVIEDVKDVRIGVNTVQTDADPAYYSAAFASTYGNASVFVNNATDQANEIRAVVEGDSLITTGMWLNGNAGALSRIQVGGDATTLIDFTVTGTADESGPQGGYSSLNYNNIAAGMYGETHSMGDPADPANYNLARADRVVFKIEGHNRTNAAGMWANTDAKNRIEADEVEFNVSTTGDGNAHGMYAGTYVSEDRGPGINTITADKVTIVVDNQDGDAYGMKAESGGNGLSSGTNTITSEGALEVDIRLPSGGVGMFATHLMGRNSIIGNSSAGNSDKITVEGGMYTDSNGKNLIQTGAGDDTVTVQGMQGAGNTVNTGAGNDTITIGGNLSGSGLIESGEGNDTILVNGTLSGGFRINGGEGDNAITVNGRVLSGSVINAGGGNSAVTVNHTGSTGANNAFANSRIVDGGRVTVTSTDTSGVGAMAVASSSTATSIEGSKIILGSESNYVAYGVYTQSGTSSATLRSSGDIDVSAIAASTTVGLMTTGSANLNADGKITVSAESATGYATALDASSDTSRNTLNAGGGIELTAAGDLAYGMIAQGKGQNELVSNGPVTINTSGLTESYGMYAHSAESKNLIRTDGDSLELTINSGGPGTSAGMHAQQSGVNEITGGSGGDLISVSGMVSNSMAGQWGRNTISTGEGDDIVRILGACTGQGNTVDLGNGNDSLYLAGSASQATFLGGAGVDSLNLDGYGGSIDLDALLGGNSVSGFEILDLSAGAYGSGVNNTLSFSGSIAAQGAESLLESLFDPLTDAALMQSLKDGSAMRVHGEAGDSVDLGGMWADTGQNVTYDNINYDVFRNDQTEEYFLVQLGLTA